MTIMKNDDGSLTVELEHPIKIRVKGQDQLVKVFSLKADLTGKDYLTARKYEKRLLVDAPIRRDDPEGIPEALVMGIFAAAADLKLDDLMTCNFRDMPTIMHAGGYYMTGELPGEEDPDPKGEPGATSEGG